MNSFSIQQGLADMRTLAAQNGEPTGVQQADNATSPAEDFAELLRDAVDNVNEQQVTAKEMSDAYMSGEEIPLTDVMMASQKASLSFEATKEVRNRLLEAYQEISNMQV